VLVVLDRKVEVGEGGVVVALYVPDLSATWALILQVSTKRYYPTDKNQECDIM
jgi:hypothetical protein